MMIVDRSLISVFVLDLEFDPFSGHSTGWNGFLMMMAQRRRPGGLGTGAGMAASTVLWTV
jgi:hypothetical protein